MNYLIFLTQAPASGQALQTALRFCQQLTACDHQIARIFLYREAVLLGQSPQKAEWITLANQHQTNLILCTQSVEDYGVSREHVKTPFLLAGLTTFFAAFRAADRLVQF